MEPIATIIREQEAVEPKDATVVKKILKDLGIMHYEKGVVSIVLEYCHRYVTSVLEDAKVFSEHAGHQTIRPEDVKLSVTMQVDKIFSTPAPRDVMMDVARAKNDLPLPSILGNCSIPLPPDEYCSVPAKIDDLF